MLIVRKIKDKWAVGLLLVFLMHLLVNVWVLHEDNIYPLYTSMGITHTGYRLADNIRNGEISDLLRLPCGQDPPLIKYLLMVNILLFGGSLDMIMHTNMLFLIILIYAVYNLGKRIGNKFSGFLSVIICLSLPAVFGTSRIMRSEYPLMCVMALSYYLLFKTEYFRNKKYSFFWALSIACGLLIRFTLPIYITIPVLLYIVKAFMVRDDYKHLIQRLLFCLFIVLALSSWWYLSCMKCIMADRLELLGNGRINIPDNLRRGYNLLCNRGMYFPLFAIFIITLPLLLVKCKLEKFIIFTAIIAPLLIFIFSPDDAGFGSNRYFTPILPLAGLSIGTVVSLVNKKILQFFIGTGLIMLSFAQFILANIGLGYILKGPVKYPDEIEKTRFIIVEQGKVKPYISKNPQDLLYLINKEKKGSSTCLLLLGDFQNTESFFRIEKVRKNTQIDIIAPVPGIMGNPNLQDLSDNPQLVDKSEFVIALSEEGQKYKDVRSIYFTGYIPKMISYFESKKNGYKKIASLKDKLRIEFALFQKTDKP